MDLEGTGNVRKECLMVRKIHFLIVISKKKVEAGADLLIVTRPTLDLREALMRITQKEMRQVMVFERERAESRSSREVVVLGRERANPLKWWEHVHIRKVRKP